PLHRGGQDVVGDAAGGGPRRAHPRRRGPARDDGRQHHLPHRPAHAPGRDPGARHRRRGTRVQSGRALRGRARAGRLGRGRRGAQHLRAHRPVGRSPHPGTRTARAEGRGGPVGASRPPGQAVRGPEIAVAATAQLGEGPTWDPATRRLLWVDILSSRVHTFDPASGATSTTDTGQHVGAAKPRTDGRGLVVNLRDGVGVYDGAGAFRWLHHEPVEGRRGNDAAVAPDGALWVGTMRYDEAPGGGTLTRFGPDGSSATVLPRVTVSNGTGWSPDGRLMYYIDTPTRRIDVFDAHDDGSV